MRTSAPCTYTSTHAHQHPMHTNIPCTPTHHAHICIARENMVHGPFYKLRPAVQRHPWHGWSGYAKVILLRMRFHSTHLQTHTHKENSVTCSLDYHLARHLICHNQYSVRRCGSSTPHWHTYIGMHKLLCISLDTTARSERQYKWNIMDAL